MKKLFLVVLFCQLACNLGLSAQEEAKSDRRVQAPSLQVSNQLDREVEAHLKAWYEDYAKHDNRAGTKKKGTLSIYQPDSVYARMLSEMPSVLTFSYNAKIKEAIQLYLGKRSRLISSMLRLAEVYFPEMEVILDKNNMPYELKYLAIVESALKPSAGSRAGAKGLWQFMAPTAKIQGLEVNSLVDERYEVEASTEAACRYLTSLYNMYDDWFLAIASYNCGPGNVNKAIKRAGGNSQNFWDIYPYLPRETQNYIPLFVGVYFAMYYHQEFGIEPRPMEMVKTIDYFELDKKVSLAQIATLSGTPLDDVKTLNPQFKRGIVPAHIRSYQVRLPFESVMRLEENYDKLEELSLIEYNKVKSRYKYTKSKKRRRSYRVRRGDTLSKIAHRHHTTVSNLKRWNHLRSTRLRVGQRLVIY